MKWLGRLFNTLVVLALSTLLVAILQPLVRSLSADGQLEGEVELGRWTDQPDKNEIEDLTSVYDKASEEERESIRSTFKDDRDYDLAYMVIRNETSQVAQNLRIKFVDGDEKSVKVFSKNGLLRQSFVDTTDISLPDMKPGDELRLYMWDSVGFYELLFSSSFKSYSSLGPISYSLSLPETSEYYEESAFMSFMDEWAAYALFILFMLMLGVSIAVNVLYGKYTQTLMQKPATYEKERARYLDNPKIFSPSMTADEEKPGE